MPRAKKIKDEIQKIVETEAPETAKEVKKAAARVKKAVKKADEKVSAEVVAAQNVIDEAVQAAEEAAPKTVKEVKKAASTAKKAGKAAAKKAEEKVSAEVVAAQNVIDEVVATPEGKEAVEKVKKSATEKVKKAAKAAEKVTKAAKKLMPQVVLQIGGQEYTEEKLTQTAKDVWQYDLGKDPKDIKTLAIYVKPEDGKAYAVVNGEEHLSFNL